ncbi:MAG: rRNA adenine N-6-methyltransferase family protein [Candidatus Lokiarchaeota archaeon]
MNKNDVKNILNQLGISPKKKWGQNFLVDEKTLQTIMEFSDLSLNDTILEVGSGLGALSEQLIKRVKKVYAYEIDPKLYKYLIQKFQDNERIEIFHNDILKVSLPDHNKIVANIPYSITGPILEKLFFKINPPEGILAIEKNLADRIFYEGNYENFSRITINVNTFMIPIEKTNISRFSFFPSPRIDLSLIKLKPRINLNDFLKEESQRQFYLDFITGIMPYKNKNISNAIILFLKNVRNLSYNKSKVKIILEELNFKDDKIFTFSIDQLIVISKSLYNLVKY